MSKRPRRVRVSLQQTRDSVIIHDMKNLAFRLSALLQNMEENYENPVFKQSVTDILGDTIRKMNAIVRHFRENRQEVVVKLRVDINNILAEVLGGFPSRALRNVQVQTSYTELPQIWGDPFYLHNAFHSIIQNALDAMPEGGTLEVRTKLLRQKKPKACIEISDTGVGMSEAFAQNELFHPFASTKPDGLGLGLFTCRQILSLHHGTMEVKTAISAGTTIRILLPVENHVE